MGELLLWGPPRRFHSKLSVNKLVEIMNIKCVSALLVFSVILSNVACADQEGLRILIKKHDNGAADPIMELRFEVAPKINTGASFKNNSINATGSFDGSFLTIQVKGSADESGVYDIRTRIAIPMSDGIVIGSWKRNGVMFDAVINQPKFNKDSNVSGPAGVDPFALKN